MEKKRKWKQENRVGERRRKMSHERDDEKICMEGIKK